MKRVKFRFGKGFRVAIGNDRAQSAEMVLDPGETEGGRDNHHRGADQWIFVVSGSGSATVNGKKLSLLPGTIVLVEKGENHEIKNTGTTPLRTVNLYVPPAYKKNGDPLPAGKG
ncbi:MAG TPA: cupin domain-containing protein [Verrucomicrobiae bacterium]|nr:cupin domain-containing protein [Verrucomicrobiae bacterium]